MSPARQDGPTTFAKKRLRPHDGSDVRARHRRRLGFARSWLTDPAERETPLRRTIPFALRASRSSRPLWRPSVQPVPTKRKIGRTVGVAPDHRDTQSVEAPQPPTVPGRRLRAASGPPHHQSVQHSARSRTVDSVSRRIYPTATGESDSAPPDRVTGKASASATRPEPSACTRPPQGHDHLWREHVS
jgi:hypothetical protein